ncbi:hypothetical protein ACNKHW_11535 [Shigella flexneri]
MKVNNRSAGIEGVRVSGRQIPDCDTVEAIRSAQTHRPATSFSSAQAPKGTVTDAMAVLHLKPGDLNLTDLNSWRAAVGNRLPMFEDDGEGSITAMHHPFTSPRDMSRKS